ncbi:protein turtle homolog A-like [Salarias fasciatus]|uniref:protein turtle homolog A-like n=1 Tax=Salarias fasciatus TaxID=181472 RepID=UPI0011766414|nr:protein turtle homolog A-like [Salarias fasciatus]
MSVDGPDSEECAAQPAKPMLHHRIASHLQHGRPLSHRGRPEVITRSTSFNFRSPAYADDVTRTPRPSEPELWRSKTWNPKKRSQSLDLRRRKESGFLTPDAWIDSLSQENCSVSPSSPPDPLFRKPQSSPPRKISKSPTNSPPATQAAFHPPPAVDPLSPMSSLETPVPDPGVACHYEPRGEEPPFLNAAKWPVAYQEGVKEAEGYTEATSDESISLPPNNSDQGLLEAETGGLEGVADSGGSYSSYASSGRGSMETATGQLSVGQLPPALSSSPETVDDTHSHQMEASQRRKASVDENYEWDAADICPQPGDRDGLLPSLNLLKPAPHCSLPSMQCSGEELKNCTRLSLLPGHQSSCSAEPEPDTVLF